MSGYTIRTPTAILSANQDGQGPNSVPVQNLRDLYGSAISVMPNVKTVSTTLALTDLGMCLVMNSASAVNVTVPPSLFQVGVVIPWYGRGAGLITFVQGASVLIERRAGATLVSAVQGAQGTLWQWSSNIWVLSGDIT